MTARSLSSLRLPARPNPTVAALNCGKANGQRRLQRHDRRYAFRSSSHRYLFVLMKLGGRFLSGAELRRLRQRHGIHQRLGGAFSIYLRMEFGLTVTGSTVPPMKGSPDRCPVPPI